jgi:hypothetical protein
MKVFWYETGIQIEPETSEETNCLEQLWRISQPQSLKTKSNETESVYLAPCVGQELIEGDV